MATKRTTSANTKRAMMDGRNALGGFTIIEVVLVLAIAGLIFMMVFIALPQLQRAQRDTQRRQDLGRLEAAITQYQTNNNGRIPDEEALKSKCTGEGDSQACASSFVKNYIVGVNGDPVKDFTDPLSDDGYEFKYETGPSSDTEVDPEFDAKTIYFYSNARCGESEGHIDKGNGSRNYAIVYRLEGNGIYCQDNAG